MADSLFTNCQADEEIGAVHIGVLIGEHVGIVGVEAQLLVTVEDGALVIENVVDTHIEEEIVAFETLREASVEVKREGGLQRSLSQHILNADVT